MRNHKNRGAGLVTVVVVFAISGILLSGALWLAYSHYKKVMKTETTAAARDEVELCAELVCMTLTELGDATSLEELLIPQDDLLAEEAKPTPLQRFYGMESCTFVGFLSVDLGNGERLALSAGEESEDWKDSLSITFVSSEGASTSGKYKFVFDEEDKSYVIVADSEDAE